MTNDQGDITMKRGLRRHALGGTILALLCAGVIAVASAGGESAREPLPFGTPPAQWTASDGSEIVDLMPERGSVATLDGGVLADADGAPVTVPLGDLARGELTPEEAEAQFARAMLLQARDACERGIGAPISASAGGETMEEAIAASERLLVEAIAANGGRRTVDACREAERMEADLR
jgi:hypothetical protein